MTFVRSLERLAAIIAADEVDESSAVTLRGLADASTQFDDRQARKGVWVSFIWRLEDRYSFVSVMS
ncbi:MAG TPA: hypothetical protein VF881_10955 [Polyangiaceae bacterium]